MPDDHLPHALDAVPAREEIIARATALIPTIRARSAACEKARRILPETVADFRDAGFFRIAKSTRFGGYGLGVDTVIEVALEIGRGCGSSAWMAGQWPGHQFMVGYFPLEAQEEYWAGGPDTMSSTASAVARLNVQPEGDGYRVTDSQLRFSSGCDEAQWILLMMAPYGQVLVPKRDFEVLDDWYVSGLRGTGSKSIVIKDAYIPPHRFVPIDKLKSGRPPGAELVDDPYLRAPMGLVLNQMLLGPTIGMARGVLDLFEERVVKRRDLHTMKPASEGAGAQLRFAESSAEVEAAIMFIRNNCRVLREWGSRDETATEVERSRLRRDTTYAAKLAVTATQRLMSQGDASGMFDDQQLGRQGRDVYMAGLQASLTWDEPAQTFSRLRWGLPATSLLN
jgi:3-hydroxy-9,10-secoandrosta-1,3,5(10)-triene-9,17-dione monooxygenase